MVAETQVNQDGKSQSAPATVARSAGELMADAMTLAELQFSLAEIDLRSAWRRLMGGVFLVAMGLLFAIATLPVILAALALAISALAPMELWLAMLITVGGALFVAAIILLWGIWRLRRRGALFARSKEELRQNTKWFKSVLRQSDRAWRRADV
jgi:uncharacterized membrane protein YqjE